VKAIVHTRYGSPDMLQLQEVEKPVPKDDEVLIKAPQGHRDIALQIAKALGAEVTAVCSTRDVDQALALGAEHVID
jgi:NADPH:quinone reductase-like Zn-dependent oxidoreductase